LETVLQEYESYYYVRFNRYPKITKKVTNTSNFLLQFLVFFCLNQAYAVLNIQDISSKISKTTSLKKSTSSVPVLPNVNSNGLTRPMSTEYAMQKTVNNNNNNGLNLTNGGGLNYGNAASKTEFKTQFSSSSQVSDTSMKKNKSFLNEKSQDQSEEFGLSVQQIGARLDDTNNNSKYTNNSNNQVSPNKNTSRKKVI
jgi:hypothetical protein